MADDKHALIPAPAGSISIGTSLDSDLLKSFVEKSLSAAREQTGESEGCSVLFGDWDDEFIDHFESELRSMCDAPGVTVRRCGEIGEIRAAMSHSRYDLAVITLNNVFGSGETPDDRVQGLLKIVEELKHTLGMPLIAISGHYDDDELPERARAAGADIFRDRADTDDLAHLAVLYLSRAYPQYSWKTTPPGN